MRCHPIGDVTAAAANIQQPLGRSASDLLFHPVQIRAGGVDGALHIGIGPLAKLPRDVRLLTRLLHLLAGSHDLHLFNSTAFLLRSEEHTSEITSIMRNSYAVLCLQQNITLTHCSQNQKETTRHK